MLSPDNNNVDELSTLRVVSFCPIVARTRLSKHEVVRPEYLPERPRSQGIHGPRLKVHKHRPGYVPPTAGLIVVNIDPLKLEIGISAVFSGAVDPVLVADHLPELGPDLVAALPALYMEDLSHLSFFCKRDPRVPDRDLDKKRYVDNLQAQRNQIPEDPTV
ncbi:hypothetical protein M5K25_014838 [Dendrobium thyrsiflorum]|uniref:Uncharacterized protein n=1 Tax=Dendrobium thyrsiflorum TaxID=117978 RepID=A0ABD0UP87_DENTH